MNKTVCWLTEGHTVTGLLETGLQVLVCQVSVHNRSRTQVSCMRKWAASLPSMEKLRGQQLCEVKGLVLCWGHLSFQASLAGGLSNKHLFIVGHCDHNGICV